MKVKYTTRLIALIIAGSTVYSPAEESEPVDSGVRPEMKAGFFKQFDQDGDGQLSETERNTAREQHQKKESRRSQMKGHKQHASHRQHKRVQDGQRSGIQRNTEGRGRLARAGRRGNRDQIRKPHGQRHGMMYNEQNASRRQHKRVQDGQRSGIQRNAEERGRFARADRRGNRDQMRNPHGRCFRENCEESRQNKRTGQDGRNRRIRNDKRTAMIRKSDFNRTGKLSKRERMRLRDHK